MPEALHSTSTNCRSLRLSKPARQSPHGMCRSRSMTPANRKQCDSSCIVLQMMRLKTCSFVKAGKSRKAVTMPKQQCCHKHNSYFGCPVHHAFTIHSSWKHSAMSLTASNRSSMLSDQTSIGTGSFSGLFLATFMQHPVSEAICLILAPLYPMSLPTLYACNPVHTLL